MRFRRQSTQRHRRSIKAWVQLLSRFHFTDIDWRDVFAQAQQVTDSRYRTLVHQLGETVVGFLTVGLYGFLNVFHNIRVIGVVFTAVHVFDQTTLVDFLTGFPGILTHQLEIFFEIGKGRALNTAGNATETQIDDFFAQTHSFKQLRTTVRGNGRDTHFGHHFQQALADSLAEILLRLQRIAQQFVGAVQIGQHVISQPRINRGRTEAQQHSKLMRVTGRTGFNDDITVGTQALFNQTVMHRTGCHNRRNNPLAVVHIAVRQDDHNGTVTHRLFCLIGQVDHRLLQTHCRVKCQRQGGMRKRFQTGGFQAMEFQR